MKTFPMFLKVAGRQIVIIGGGEQAAQKARLALKTEADVVLVAPELNDELQYLVNAGQALHLDRTLADPFSDAALVFVATGCKGADAAWHARAKAAGALVNVVDNPELCDAMTPSIVDRDPVVVAIGTEGTAPVLGRRIKTRIEEILHPRLGAFAALAGSLRNEVARHIAPRQRRDFWRWVFAGAPWRAFAAGQENAALQQINARIATGQAARRGRTSIILGALDPGLVPMTAIERLQEADLIYSDRDVPDAILELARRDAERVVFRDDASAGHSPFRFISAQRADDQVNVVYLTRSQDPLEISSDGQDIEQIRCAETIVMRSPDPTAPEITATPVCP